MRSEPEPTRQARPAREAGGFGLGGFNTPCELCERGVSLPPFRTLRPNRRSEPAGRIRRRSEASCRVLDVQ